MSNINGTQSVKIAKLEAQLQKQEEENRNVQERTVKHETELTAQRSAITNLAEHVTKLTDSLQGGFEKVYSIISDIKTQTLKQHQFTPGLFAVITMAVIAIGGIFVGFTTMYTSPFIQNLDVLSAKVERISDKLERTNNSHIATATLVDKIRSDYNKDRFAGEQPLVIEKRLSHLEKLFIEYFQNQHQNK